MSGKTLSNVIAIAVAIVVIVAGIQYLRSRPQEDECARWQSVVKRQAELLSSQRGGRPLQYYEAAAQTYSESRPEGCATPTTADDHPGL